MLVLVCRGTGRVSPYPVSECILSYAYFLLPSSSSFYHIPDHFSSHSLLLLDLNCSRLPYPILSFPTLPNHILSYSIFPTRLHDNVSSSSYPHPFILSSYHPPSNLPPPLSPLPRPPLMTCSRQCISRERRGVGRESKRRKSNSRCYLRIEEIR